VATVYVGLGSNLGDKGLNLDQAFEYLAEAPDIILQRVSSRYETEPWGVSGQEPYWNQVLCLETSLDPEILLNRCQEIERRLGRKRLSHWGPRTIDLDLLLVDDLVYGSETLQLPHPYMKERLFVLIPLAEIAPGLVLPPEGIKVEEVVRLARKTHPYGVKKI
jgi:2-amino-4-hydroxy-6-hydroxymethyldihydropteridine diphosphokinase